MAAGENTLNALCARLVIRSMTAAQKYDPKQFLEDYVAFMYAPIPLHLYPRKLGY